MINAEIIRQCVGNGQYFYSMHADIERQADQLTFAEIEMALLNCQLLEYYLDTRRGKK
jgi:hypothetical protein